VKRRPQLLSSPELIVDRASSACYTYLVPSSDHFLCLHDINCITVTWTVMSEIMPTRLRMKAVSLFLSVNWGANLVIGLLTLTAIDGLGGVKKSMDDDEVASAEKNGVAYLYFIFAAFTVMCLLFMHACVPETKGTTPEQHTSK
jgi:hypothetical protein